MDQIMSNDREIEIEFYESYVPPIEPGNYKINVEQKIEFYNNNNNSKDQSFPIEKKIVVKGPRFALSPSDINSVFPPSNHHGNFDTCLPHIILTRATIPWERKLSENTNTPWMALLLFYENEILETQTLKIKDFCKNNTFKIPNLKNLTESEKEESCVVIEISLELFNKVFPSEKELEILAHVRRTDNNGL
jgi:hypothetical protein